MEQHTAEAQAWADLLSSEIAAENAQRTVTRRAKLYLHAGLMDLDAVLDALKISRATWYRRVQEEREHGERAIAEGKRWRYERVPGEPLGTVEP